MADTLPRMASGVASCMIVTLVTTEIPSKIPESTSSTAAAQKLDDSAKAMMQIPKPLTATSNHRPLLLLIG